MTDHDQPKGLKTLLRQLSGRLHAADRIAPEPRVLAAAADPCLIVETGPGLSGLRDERVTAERASHALATLDRIHRAHRRGPAPRLHPSPGAALNAT